jgi:hypothetical protein
VLRLSAPQDSLELADNMLEGIPLPGIDRSKQKNMAPEPRTIRAFFEKQLADLRDTIGSARVAAIVSDEGCMAPDPMMQAAVTLHGSRLRNLAATAAEPAANFEVGAVRCLIIDGMNGVLIVRLIATRKPRLLVVVLEDRADVSRALNGVHRIAGEIETRLA